MLKVSKEKQAVLLNLIRDTLHGIHVEAALGVAAIDIKLRGISIFPSSPGRES